MEIDHFSRNRSAQSLQLLVNPVDLVNGGYSRYIAGVIEIDGLYTVDNIHQINYCAQRIDLALLRDEQNNDQLHG